MQKSKYLTLITALLLFLPMPSVNAQQIKDNLFVFAALADSAVNRLPGSSVTAGDTVYLDFSASADYSVIRGWAASLLAQRGVILGGNSAKPLMLTINRAQAKYPAIFKSSSVGGYNVLRQISMDGSWVIAGRQTVAFSFSVADTVAYDAVQGLESDAYLFSRGEVPAEPFWGSIVEPLVVLGAAAVTVYLFFSVRSK